MMDFATLAALDGNDLTRLAELLEAGLLKPPLGALTLRGHIADAHAGALSECFEDLSHRGMPPDHIAATLRAFAAGRQAGGVSAPIEVVVSGPDTVATARDTGVVVRQLFDRARTRVLAVGFAVHQGKSVFQTLARHLDADESLEVTLCIDVRRQRGDTALDSQVVRRFAENFVDREWPGTRLPRVYYDPRSLAPPGKTASALHAKCVVADGREALVTSANFTEAAQARNMELGLLVAAPAVAGRIEEHFHSLIRDGHLERLPLP